ncbi:MAG: hypothetical protein WA871_05380 [Candidatus Acidiferrales bacterium]
MRLPLHIRHYSSLAAVLVLAGLVALPVRAQESPAMPGHIRNQLNQSQASSPSSQTEAAPSAPANTSNPAGQHASGKSRKSHKGSTTNSATSSAPAPASTAVSMSGRRDPFSPLLAADKGASTHPDNLPPGKAGLMVDTLRVDGIVQGPNGMIAIVENPQDRVYFLREGDKLYDGSVTHIVLDAVSFHQVGSDAFGKPVDRELTKRLYPSSTGDSQ